jgi:hypothetical protein
MAACGHAYPARPPTLGQLAHIRAMLAARLWLESAPAYANILKNPSTPGG